MLLGGRKALKGERGAKEAGAGVIRDGELTSGVKTGDAEPWLCSRGKPCGLNSEHCPPKFP